jgi:trigger factor
MKCTIKKLPKSLVELSIEVDAEEVKPFLDNAAKDITKEKPIPGFRPGNASYDVVKSHYGEMAIYETALPAIIRKFYVKAVTDNKVFVFSEPQIDMKKLAPGNPVAFAATVAVIPKVLSVPELSKIKVKSKKPVVEEKELDAAIKELQKMRTKETLADREVRAKDKVVMDMDMFLAGVPVEGGQARGHGIYLDEDYFIPGMREALLGLKTGEQKKFQLKFPEQHYQKHLAGKDVDFSINIKGVYELGYPELNDEFAKSVGQESLVKLRELIKKNMTEEAAEKESQRAENEALEKIVDKARLEDVPDVMVNQEVERMLHELKHGVVDQGLDFDTYLKNIKKSIDDLKLDFTPRAVKRVQVALVMKEIGDKSSIEVSDSDVLAETQRLLNAYSDDAEAQTKIRSDEYQEYLHASLRNRKIVELVKKETIVEVA